MSLFEEPRFFHDVTDALTKRAPQALAAVSRTGQQRCCLSYTEICERSKILAAGLARLVRSQRQCFDITGEPASIQDKLTESARTVAVELPRTHVDFLPLLVALSRTVLPFVLLSSDLPDKALETERNTWALRTINPWLCITATSSNEEMHANEEVSTSHKTIHEVSAAGSAEEVKCPVGECNCQSSSPLLGFLFTGGTHRTKIVQVTHAMFLHEYVSYKDVWQPGSKVPVVLAHTSVYWGASALGQLSIALAYGGTVVWSDATQVSDLHRCIVEEGVTILGLVPEVLELLAPSAPEMELPSIECVFTWGERLPHRVAERWRAHPRAVLRELLIATEYWLTLYCDPLRDGPLRMVRHADIIILADGGNVVEDGQIGELYIHGPMVMAGYLDSAGAAVNDDVFRDVAGRRYLRTGDLVRRVPGGLIYKGRADMMAKYKGKWVDMIAVESAIQSLDGVHAATVIPDPRHEHFHVFVQFTSTCSPVAALSAVRESLPGRSQLWIVPHLPRHSVTQKVDRNALLLSLPKPPPSWPFESAASPPTSQIQKVLRERLDVTMWRQYAWTLSALATSVAVADARNYLSQLKIAVVCLASTSIAASRGPVHTKSKVTCALMAAWCVLAIGIRLRLKKVVRCVCSGMLLPYTWLAIIYLDELRRPVLGCHVHGGIASRAAGVVMAVIDLIPFWKLGTFGLLSSGAHCLPNPCARVCRFFLAALSFLGMSLTWQRRRLLAWPVVFWGIAVGNQLDIECHSWLTSFRWRREILRWLRAPSALSSFLIEIVPWARRAPVRSVHHTAYIDRPNVASKPVAFECASCHRWVGPKKQPAVDTCGRYICDDCATTAVLDEEMAAKSWVGALLEIDQAETPESFPNLQKPGVRSSSNAKSSITEAIHFAYDRTKGDSYAKQYRDFDNWWWYTQTEEYIDFGQQEHDLIMSQLEDIGTDRCEASRKPMKDVPQDLRIMCATIEEVLPHLSPVSSDTSLIGLDSLNIAKLVHSIKARLGRAVSAMDLRVASNVAALYDELGKTPAPSNSSDDEPASDVGCEFAIFFSPGQHIPMGSWVLRSDDAINMAALKLAVQRLVERHSALRAKVIEPLRYMSVVYDSAALWCLIAPRLNACRYPLVGALARIFRRLVSSGFTYSWPRVRCSTREQIYDQHYPDNNVPLDVVHVDSQGHFERELRANTHSSKPPFAARVYECKCDLVDVWAYSNEQDSGRFSIVQIPGSAFAEGLLYVDAAMGEWGPLRSPLNSDWCGPPYRFGAIFFVPLNTGQKLWIRLEEPDEIRICLKTKTSQGEQVHHFVAFRAAPRRRHAHTTIVSFLSLTMFHCFSDGNSYMPLAEDLFAFYDEACGRKGASISRRMGPLPFEILQRRLMDTLLCGNMPARSSLRGSNLFYYEGRGYSHCYGIEAQTVSMLARIALSYRVPFDVMLLGLITCGIARADRSELVEFTLYAPMRDGTSEAMMIGLFSDWRDVSVGVDLQLATVLGTIMQIWHIINHRHWRPFNALRKPEATIINIQPLDMTRRSHFQNLGENLWHGGDRLRQGAPERPNKLDEARQPLTFNLEQQDDEIWWILVDIGYCGRPPSWMRCFSASLRCAFHDLFFSPTSLVHKPFDSIEF